MDNPYYVPALRNLSGSDQAVREFVLGNEATREFLGHLEPLLRFALPRYEAEKKAHEQQTGEYKDLVAKIQATGVPILWFLRGSARHAHVALESGECADAGAIAKDTIAGNALIQDRDGSSGFFQTTCEDIRPATVGIDSRVGPVGNRIPKHHNPPYRRTGLDHDASQEETVCEPVHDWEFGACGEIARRRNIGGLKPIHVNRPEVRGSRQIQAHCDVGKGSDI
jgi:hypothetical protein